MAAALQLQRPSCLVCAIHGTGNYVQCLAISAFALHFAPCAAVLFSESTAWLVPLLCHVCCRDDGLELRHWVKGYKDANGRIRDAQEGDYAFAKYNKKVGLLLACANVCVQHAPESTCNCNSLQPGMASKWLSSSDSDSLLVK
jgi:hypothetical protein